MTLNCESQHGERMTTWLVDQGFVAVEERTSDEGVQLLVYDESEEKLQQAASELKRQAGAAKIHGGVKIEVERMDPSWRLAWTEHLQPVRLTPRLVVVPTVPPQVRVAGELYLEPALAFGFGEHPSTTRIAPWLEAACRKRPGSRVLDVGCGTGVLSLVAASSGACAVVGVDTSSEAVQAARTNAEHNRLQANTEFLDGSADATEEKFDIVCANIESGILLALASEISCRLNTGGKLVLAGLLLEQEQEVVAAYLKVGVSLQPVSDETSDGQWSLLAGGLK